jgi:predicted GNAT family acetyltransferase
MSNKPEFDIQHHSDQHRFETIIEGHRCEIDYRLSPGRMHITHTGVPRALEGRGIAAALVHRALTWARSQQLKVDPVCSYVAAYLRRHPEWHDLS